MRVHPPIRLLWGLMPSGGLKDRLRVVYRNRRAAGRARYRLIRGEYHTTVGTVTLRSRCQPFRLPDEVLRYTHQYTPRAGDVVIDAGAYDGLFACYCAQLVGTAGRVVAVEPDPTNLARVRDTVAANGVADQVTVVDRGLWDSPGEVEFFAGGDVGASSFYRMPGARITTIRVTTLDDLVGELGLSRVDFVKLNIEGAEVRALPGAAATIAHHRPRLAATANHTICGVPTRPFVEAWLGARGYRLETATLAEEPMTYATPAH